MEKRKRSPWQLLVIHTHTNTPPNFQRPRTWVWALPQTGNPHLDCNNHPAEEARLLIHCFPCAREAGSRAQWWRTARSQPCLRGAERTRLIASGGLFLPDSPFPREAAGRRARMCAPPAATCMQYTTAGLLATAWWPGVDALEGAELGSYTLG